MSSYKKYKYFVKFKNSSSFRIYLLELYVAIRSLSSYSTPFKCINSDHHFLSPLSVSHANWPYFRCSYFSFWPWVHLSGCLSFYYEWNQIIFLCSLLFRTEIYMFIAIRILSLEVIKYNYMFHYHIQINIPWQFCKTKNYRRFYSKRFLMENSVLKRAFDLFSFKWNSWYANSPYLKFFQKFSFRKIGSKIF